MIIIIIFYHNPDKLSETNKNPTFLPTHFSKIRSSRR